MGLEKKTGRILYTAVYTLSSDGAERAGAGHGTGQDRQGSRRVHGGHREAATPLRRGGVGLRLPSQLPA